MTCWESCRLPLADIEHLGEGLSSEVYGFVKGIIKQKSDEAEKRSTSLIIWIDMQKMIEDVAKSNRGKTMEANTYYGKNGERT